MPDEICDVCDENEIDCRCDDEPTDAQLAAYHGGGFRDAGSLDEDMMVHVPGQMPYYSGL